MEINFSPYILALFLFLSLSSLDSFGQSQNNEVPHPKFSSFTGMVYDMPKLEIQRGKLKTVAIQEYYSDTIYTYPELGEISLDQLNIKESYTREDQFPGVDKTVKFAMILNAKMEILVDGCYEFTLRSDDGSRLWIDEQQIVNNDGGHKMKTKIDSMAFTKGSYDAKVWYFQGMPDRFGLLLDAKIVGKPEVCPVEIEEKEKKISKVIMLENIFFEHDTYQINDLSLEQLKNAAEEILSSGNKLIHVVGHTDDSGAPDYNKKLSLQRAESIKSKLIEYLNDPSIELICFGEGASQPIASNNTPEGQSKNRRVELVLK